MKTIKNYTISSKFCDNTHIQELYDDHINTGNINELVKDFIAYTETLPNNSGAQLSIKGLKGVCILHENTEEITKKTNAFLFEILSKYKKEA